MMNDDLCNKIGGVMTVVSNILKAAVVMIAVLLAVSVDSKTSML